MKFLGLVWANLKRKKLRTSLTVLSILVAFLLFGFLCAIKQGLGGGVELAGVDRLITRNKVSLIMSLPLNYEARIASVPGVESTAHQSWFGGIYQDPKNFFPSFPVQPEKFLAMYPEFILAPAQKEAWIKTRTGAIIGRKSAEKYHFKIGDHIPLTCPIWGEPANQDHWDFEIVGIFDGAKKGTDTTGIYFQYDYFDEARTRNKGEIGWLGVRVKNPDQAAEVAKAIDEQFANSPYETKTEPEGAFAASFAAQIGDIGTIMMAVLSAVFFTILLVAGNTMSQAVRERTEELGVLKAMGFTNELVLVLVLMESCVISALGGLIGLGLGWVLVSVANPASNVMPSLSLPPHDLIVGFILVFVLGVVAGVVPAVQAMHLRIAVALRRNA